MNISPTTARTAPRLPELFLSAAEAAAVLGVSRRRFHVLVEEKKLTIDGYVDGDARYRWTQLERYVLTGRSESLEVLPRKSQSGKPKSVQTKVRK